MNAKNSLLVLVAVMLLVSQLFGEGSTIASVASSEDAELQQAMKRGEEVITNAAMGTNKTRTNRKTTPGRTDATSLSEFYDVEEDVQEIAPEDIVSDEDPDTGPADSTQGEVSVAPVAQRASASSSQSVGTYDRPYEPFVNEDE